MSPRPLQTTGSPLHSLGILGGWPAALAGRLAAAARPHRAAWCCCCACRTATATMGKPCMLPSSSSSSTAWVVNVAVQVHHVHSTCPGVYCSVYVVPVFVWQPLSWGLCALTQPASSHPSHRRRRCWARHGRRPALASCCRLPTATTCCCCCGCCGSAAAGCYRGRGARPGARCCCCCSCSCSCCVAAGTCAAGWCQAGGEGGLGGGHGAAHAPLWRLFSHLDGPGVCVGGGGGGGGGGAGCGSGAS
jgi:hypothetical protein